MRAGRLLIATVLLIAARAGAEPEPPDPPDEPVTIDPCLHFHAGLDIRTDLGTHPIRTAFGVRRQNLDGTPVVAGTLVLDPYAFLDGQHDLDLLVERFFGPRIGLLAGWRWTAISVNNGILHQQRSLVGITGIGPTFGPVQTSASLELAILWVKHGAGTMTEWISADRNLLDHFGFGLFARFDYVR
jgi:hypothetical protein